MLVYLHLVGLMRLAERGLLDARVGYLHVVHGLPGEKSHGTVSELALLTANVDVGTLAMIAGGELDIAVVAVVALAVGLSALVYHLDVEHACSALGIVFGAR